MRNGPIAILTFSPQGLVLAQRLRAGMECSALFVHESLPAGPEVLSFAKASDLFAVHFHSYACWICIAPSGLVVRSIAPLLKSKLSDPAVLVVDAGGRHVVSLLGGHEGGGNAFTVLVANILGADPVISTTTEAVKTWIAGVGCRKGALCADILSLLDEGLRSLNISRQDLRFLATAAVKQDEPGLLEAAEILDVPLRIMDSQQIQSLAPMLGVRSFVQERVGLPGVAEPAALLGGRRTQLCLPRISRKGVTIALARENCWWWVSVPEVGMTAPSVP